MIKTLNKKEKLLLLSSNYIGNLGFIYKDKPFVLPITYFFNEEQNNIICYSAEGHKTNALRKNNAASLSVLSINSVNDWKSVLVHGNYEEQTGSSAKALLHQFSLGIKDIILRNELKDLDFINQFSAKIYTEEIPVIFTISIDEISGKRRKY